LTFTIRSSAAFAKAQSDWGRPIKIRYFSQTIGSVWDDQVVLSESGTGIWTTGVLLPVSPTSSSDSLLMEQGKLMDSDQRLYVNGSLLLTGSIYQVQVQIGSPSGEQYSIIEPGFMAYETQGVQIYKKAYIRRLPIGSLSP
jgi:hypothetical protein